MKDSITRDKTNYCVICGNEIPEGLQICPDCVRAVYERESWTQKKKKKKSGRDERLAEKWK